jgi:translation initiation factor IF-2
VKPGVILDLLPVFGVSEKKTHSSSIDEDVAITVRQRIVNEGLGIGDRPDTIEAHADAEEDTARLRSKMTQTSVALEDPPIEHSEPSTVTTEPRKPAAPVPGLRDQPGGPRKEEKEQEKAPAHPGVPAGTAPAEPERPRPFQPLRPPIHAGGAIHPPLAPNPQPAPSVVNRNVSVPARPIPSPVRPGSGPTGSSPTGLAPTGPRQPLPPDLQRSAPTVPPRSARPPLPASPGAPPAQAAPPIARPSQPGRSIAIPPTHVVLPGTAPSASAVPGAPMPRPAPPARPANLTPGAPIAPRPPSTRLVGQPSARPVVPPRPDVLARLQQQSRPPMPGAPRPSAPPRHAGPTPGQPIFRAPMRPGQPSLRGGPGMPTFGQRPPLRPGQRPMHPTTPLRPESATPVQTEQRRHQGKPGGRPRTRDKEQEEGILRQRSPKRSQIAEPPPIDREITVSEGITVKELSEKLGVKANLVIKKLVEKKIFATINQTLDTKLADDIARNFGASTNKITFEE